MLNSADCMLGEKRLLFTDKGLGLTYARDLTLDLTATVTESRMESFVIGEVGFYDLASRVRTDALLLPSLTFSNVLESMAVDMEHVRLDLLSEDKK